MIVIKRYILFTLLISGIYTMQSQIDINKRAEDLKAQLDSLQASIPALNKKVDFSINNTEFPNFIRAIANTHKLNISIDPALKDIYVTQNFANVSVKDILVFSCRKYDLDIQIIGSIISIRKNKATPYKPRDILIVYDAITNLFSIDLQNDSLAVAFKKITNITGKNLVFSPELSGKKLSGYIKNKSFESALDKLAFSNNLLVTNTKDGYYLFEKAVVPKSNSKNNKPQRTIRYKSANFYFKVLDTTKKTLDVDFENISMANVVKEIGFDLNINMFTAYPLEKMGNTSFKANNITFDTLLDNVFEKDSLYSYKKDNNIYYFGKRKQTSLRSTVSIPLLHRSIQIMDEPIENQLNNSNNNGSYTQRGSSNSNSFQNRNYNNNQNNSLNNNSRSFGNSKTRTEALLDVLPKEIRASLEIKTDVELNSFILSGPTQQIEKFKDFIKLIDKPVPVILIEVMILEVSKSATVSTGVTLGIGETPTTTKGAIYPNTNLDLGATTINKIIGGFKGFGTLNLGNVVPNFYAKIEAMEANGDVDIKSTPKLATLNGHEAYLSSGERSYYAITTTDIIGTQNPQTREIKNYVPIDANLTIKIRPLVSGDGSITLSIKVVQSSFNGKKVDPDAPPGINSREFTSAIRVKDQDVVILGGLEENIKSDSGSGVPFLARVPIIKWLFSKRSRTDSKMKLSVLIKSTIIK